MTSWTPRQVAMLAEMGITVWSDSSRGEVGAVAAPAVAVSPAVQAPAVTSPAVQRHAAAADGHLPSVDRLDWRSLRDAAAGCTACGLCEGRTHSVFGTGRPGAHWLVVGEPPDDAADAAGAAFAGAPGLLLDNMLRAVGVSRVADDIEAEVPATDDAMTASTTAVVKCRPPHGRPATAGEVTTCRAYLIRQVALLRPRIVLAMGRWPAFSLLGSDEPLGRQRGKVHRVGGVAVVVTYDPAYLLRNPQDKAKAWVDLCMAADTLSEMRPD